ncbi:MAG: rod shape-determining protein RodA [Fibrobacterales bacterium]|nr:rod shape-determining protein RodA [Fibrobacterales bacterium]MBP5187589.1 rod shape-determining protein RodA [Fibrobacterales bacterium]MBP5350687.1 rod shape-determining protein RodA [Fibrobacterales bacterium]
MLDREFLERRIDPIFCLVAAALASVGILLVYSATKNEELALSQCLWFKQILYTFAGLLCALFIVLLPPRALYEASWPLYLVSLALLLYVAMGGGSVDDAKGAARWIKLPGFNLQPSEVAKVAYLLVLSRYLSGREVRLENLFRAGVGLATLSPLWRPLAGASGGRRAWMWEMGLVPLFCVPFLLVLKQPDLSTALVFMAMTLTMFFWAGLPLRELFLLVSPGLSLISSLNMAVWVVFIVALLAVLLRSRLQVWISVLILAANLLAGGMLGDAVWNSLEDHQRSRLQTFVDPTRDDRGAGYQVRQSFVAIGSGGLTGKGYLEGSQTNLDFLPEEHTDFIFGVLGEQFGFLGCTAVLGLFFMLVSRTLSVTTRAGNPFGNLVVVGSAAILGFHVAVNVAMTVGFMPVTGLPLPFISYGGTFMMTVMCLCGLIAHVRFHSHDA